MYRLHYGGIVAAALAEDLGSGDLTTDSIFSDERGEAAIVTRESGVAAGLALAREVFAQVDGEIHFQSMVEDGDEIAPGDCLAILRGPVGGILKGERVALNFLQRMSGIATATRLAVKSISGSGARIVDTRKTTPGLRILEKYAVRVGGGENHRFNLSDMVLIKDNHIRGAGSISEAVRRVRGRLSFAVKIEVETSSLEDVREAVDCGVELIMLDNMPVTEMAEAVKIVNGKSIVEASGGITFAMLPEVAAAGVDLISLGYLTYGSRALDLSLELAGDK